MIASDRHRVVVASVFTLVALPALWLFNRDSAGSSGAPRLGAAGVEAVDQIGDGSPPATDAYQPEPPLFVGGSATQPTSPPVIDVAVPKPPGPNDLLTRASFKRFLTGTGQCTMSSAPQAAVLTVVNVDNGQTTTCTNTLSIPVPAGVGIVLQTEVFSEIGDLAEAPLPVRVSW